MRIGDRPIGFGNEVYIIAELGVNHDGSVERALELTDAAADAGADAVKLQLFTADLLMSKTAKLAAYQQAAGETDPLEMLRRLEMSIQDMAKVVQRAHERGIHAIVTVFSVDLVPIAETLAWDAYKTASPDIVHAPLLEAISATGKPVIVSTGAASMDEVKQAVSWFSSWKRLPSLALLQCVSSYPAPREHAELGGIAALARIFRGPVGYSDHTPDISTGALAVVRGATILEKHMTYSRSAAGPDHRASLEPAQFKQYVEHAHRAVGQDVRKGSGGGVEKRVLPIEQDVRTVSRQSLVAVRDLPAGHVLTAADVTFKRPGTGYWPSELPSVLGKTLVESVAADTVIPRQALA